MRPEVLGGIGGFGALVEVPLDRYRKPVLVSGTDGVGTKLRLAIDSGRHDTVGIDLVAMCANDVVVQGAEPLYFLDYFATGKLDVDVGQRVIAGIVEGCVQAGCALVGGETAEMPGMYQGEDYDLAGFCVGIVEKERIIDGSKTAAGDVVLGLPSSGPHSNGFSLIRKILQLSAVDLEEQGGRHRTHRSADGADPHLRQAASRVAEPSDRAWAFAHHGRRTARQHSACAAGGLGSRSRSATAWPRDPVFEWLQSQGRIPDAEMYRVFNCGIGMTVQVAARDADRAVAALRDAGQPALRIGEVRSGGRGVVIA